MSDHAHAVEATHPAEHGPAVEHAHPNFIGYIKVAIVLTLITIGEVAIYYIESLKEVLPWLLVALSAIKFAIVAAFYMHLKFDSRLFTAFFVGGLVLAGSIVLAFMTLSGAWTHIPTAHPAAGH